MERSRLSEAERCLASQVTQLQEIERAIRARVAELEAKLAESERRRAQECDMIVDLTDKLENMDRELAAATKRAGEETQDGN